MSTQVGTQPKITYTAPAVAQAAISENYAVGYDGNLPSAGGLIAGIARYDYAAGDQMSLHKVGIVKAIAGAAIAAAGTKLQVTATGKFITATNAGEVVAVAVGTASADGDEFLVELINGTRPFDEYIYTAADVIPANYAIGYDGDFPSAGGLIAGIAIAGAANGAAVTVKGSGIATAVAGAEIAAVGTELQATAAGKLITKTSGVGVAVALETAAADGDTLSVRII
jgi:hypothetical protein